MKIDLEGQKILVTGGSRGIGAAIVQALMEAGAQVAVHYRKEKEQAEHLAKKGNTNSQAFQADLSDPQACFSLFQQVKSAFGGLDTLINNAGVAHMAPINMDNAEWQQLWAHTMAVNLDAAALLSREAIQHFIPNGGGRLIHIASRAAFRGDTPDYLAYAASKGGLVALHRSIARGFGKQNIKSFLIAPGFVRTDMAQDFMDEYGEDYALNDIALPNLTEPKDLGPLVALLASGLADHATGTSIDVNAGSYVH